MGDIRIPALKGFSLDDFRGWCKRQRIAAILNLNNPEQVIPGIIEKAYHKPFFIHFVFPPLHCTKIS